MDLVTLAVTATLFGGMMLYSFGFAPFLFKALPAEDAGRLIRQAFPWYYLFIIAVGLAAAILMALSDVPRAAALAAVALSTVYARQSLMPTINAARDAGDKKKFGRLHGLSVLINMVQLAALVWVLAAYA